MNQKASKRIIKIIKALFYLYVGIFAIIWLVSAPIIHHFTKEVLKPLGLLISDETSIRYNPFLTELNVSNLSVRKESEQEKDVLSIKSLDVQVRLFSLLFKELHVSEFSLQGLYLFTDVNDENITVSGIALPKSQEGQQEIDKNYDSYEAQHNQKVAKVERTEETVAVADDSENDPADDFSVVIPKFNINNSLFDTQINASRQQFFLDDLTLSSVELSANKQSLLFALNSKINQAPLTVKADILLENGLGQISTEVGIDKLAFDDFAPFLPSTIDSVSGQLSYQGEHNIALTDNGVNIINQAVKVNVSDFSVSTEGKTVNLTRTALNSDFLSILLANNIKKDSNTNDTAEQKVEVKGGVSLALSSFNAFANKDQHIAGFEQFTTGAVDITTDELQAVTLHWDKFTLTNAYFSDNIQNDVPALTKLGELTVNNTSASASGISIDSIFINGVAVNVHIDAQKQLINLVALSQPSDEVDSGAETEQVEYEGEEHEKLDNQASEIATAAEQQEGIAPELNQEQLSAVSKPKSKTKGNKVENSATQRSAELETDTGELTLDKIPVEENLAEPSDKPAFFISLNKLKLTEPAKIMFLDESVNPHFQQNILLSQFSAGPFDTRLPEQASPYEIIGSSNDYSKIQFTGQLKPFADLKEFAIKGHFNEFDLPPISSYMKDALGYEIQSGQLDLSVDAKLTGTIVEGDMVTLLRGIDLKAADQHEEGNLTDQSSVPFNVALGMLKDSDGNVELDLSLDGDTSSPTFGLSGFLSLLVKKATILAAKDYLMTTFVPYANVVTIAVAAGKYALKVSINDLIYSAGQIELAENQQVFLQQFSALLVEKPELQVKLCPVSTPADIGKQLTDSVANEQDIEKLRKISTARASLLKAQLVEVYQVDSARLLTCTPQISVADDAQPSIQFVI